MKQRILLVALACVLLPCAASANTFFSSGWRGKRQSTDLDENALIIRTFFVSPTGAKLAQLISSNQKTYTDVCRMISHWSRIDYETHNIPEFEGMLLELMCDEGYEKVMDILRDLLEFTDNPDDL